MARMLICIAVAFSIALAITAQASPGDEVRLVEVAASERQWTGIAVSREGRIFVNFPRWSPDVPVSVGELNGDGTVRPYPGEEPNDWKPGDDPGTHFICVQSVHVDSKDRLWILDPANPMLMGVVAGGPKLVEVDLGKNEIVRTVRFDSTIAPHASYLNDVRIDTETETAFITESGLGALVIVDLGTGSARRLLADHPSTKAEDIDVLIGGRPFPAKINADGIALDSAEGCLYFQALTGRTLYRVPTAVLRDESLDLEHLAASVERFAESGVSDGLLFGPGGIYVSALEEGSIKIVDSEGAVRTVVKDPRIIWPDSFAKGADGCIYFTTSQIHLGPSPPTPYRILKICPGR
jgi:sugar lactone lactonase YvrE